MTMPSRQHVLATPGLERGRTDLYCLLPPGVDPELRTRLARHCNAEREVSVIVERRTKDRRRRARRGDVPERSAPSAGGNRRRIRNLDGRRLADRRSPLELVDAAALLSGAGLNGLAKSVTFARRLPPAASERADVDDNRLVLRIQADPDDPGKKEELYRRLLPQIRSYARTVLSRDDAEDAAQEVFLKVADALPSYEIKASTPLRTWLRCVTLNHARDLARRHARVNLCSPAKLRETRVEEARAGGPAEQDATAAAMLRITDHRLAALIRELPPAQRTAIFLRHWPMMTTGEIARALGKSTNAVRILEHRGLRTLREGLSANGGGATE